MLTKTEYYKNLSSSIDRDELMAKLMESASIYARNQFPHIERTIDARPGIVSLELIDMRSGIRFCEARSLALDRIFQMKEPIGLTALVGTEYCIIHDFSLSGYSRHFLKFMREARSYELGHSLKEHFDSTGALYRLERESNVRDINVAQIAGPIIYYLKLKGISRT